MKVRTRKKVKGMAKVKLYAIKIGLLMCLVLLIILIPVTLLIGLMVWKPIPKLLVGKIEHWHIIAVSNYIFAPEARQTIYKLKTTKEVLRNKVYDQN